MRPCLVIALVLLMATTVPAQPPVTDGLPPGQVDLVKWGMTQGALAVVLIIVLWSYRRDFFRRVEERQGVIEVLREEKQMMATVIEKNTTSQQSVALALAANTQATQTLATNVDRLERSLKS